jgi:hypothetical protein
MNVKYSFMLNIFLCNEYIINIKRNIIYLLGDSHYTSNMWKNYLCQVSTFYGIKEVKQTEPWRGKTPFRRPSGLCVSNIEMNLKLLVTESGYEGVKWASLTECRDHTGFLWTRDSVSDG